MSGPISPTLAASPPSQRHQAAAIFVLLAFCFSMCQFLRSALAVIAPDMMRESSLDPGQMGLITSTFFFAVAITQIPAGILFDRYGVRVVIATALIAAVSGGLVFAYGHDFWAYALGMALMGFGTSPVFMGSIILVGRWFPPQRFATLSGLMSWTRKWASLSPASKMKGMDVRSGPSSSLASVRTVPTRNWR